MKLQENLFKQHHKWDSSIPVSSNNSMFNNNNNNNNSSKELNKVTARPELQCLATTLQPRQLQTV